MDTPARAPAGDSPVLRLIYIACRLSEFISVGSWIGRLTGRRPDSAFYGWYLIAWLAGLLVALGFAPGHGNWTLAVACIGLYRLQDLTLGTISDAFMFRRFTGSWQSKVGLAIVNLAQLVVIFALAYLAFAPGTAFRPAPPPGRFGYIYLSFSSLPALGSGFAAQTQVARVLVMIESAVGIALTVIALGRFLSITDSPADPPQATAAGAPAAGPATVVTPAVVTPAVVIPAVVTPPTGAAGPDDGAPPAGPGQ